MISAGAMVEDRRLTLTPRDLRSMGIGVRFFTTSLDLIPEDADHRRRISRYIASLKEMIDRGVGLYLYGPYGAGKTALGVILLKEVRARLGRGYLLSAGDLTQVYIEKTVHHGYTVMDLAKAVDLLVLDDFASEYWTAFNSSVAERLVRHRSNERRSLVITSNLKPKELTEKVGRGLASVIAACTIPIRVSGIDWRVKERSAQKKALGDV